MVLATLQACEFAAPIESRLRMPFRAAGHAGSASPSSWLYGRAERNRIEDSQSLSWLLCPELLTLGQHPHDSAPPGAVRRTLAALNHVLGYLPASRPHLTRSVQMVLRAEGETVLADLNKSAKCRQMPIFSRLEAAIPSWT